MILKVDKIIFMSTGSYSDYSVHAHLKVLKEFDYVEQMKDYLEVTPKTREEPVPEEWKSMKWWKDRTSRTVYPRTVDSFISFLLRRELVEEIEVTEFHEDF